MQTEQKQTHHGGTGEQETELGSAPDEKRPEDPDTLQTGEPDEDKNIRNPAGEDLKDAVTGDEGSGRNI
jgi:hypothetical protein